MRSWTPETGRLHGLGELRNLKRLAGMPAKLTWRRKSPGWRLGDLGWRGFSKRLGRKFLARFRTLIDGGRLTVSIVNGRMVIHLPQDILFESGSATLSREGRQTLGEVGGVLAELNDRRFQVEGHTDNVPISTARFPSNWELAAARSLSVVHLLTEQGVSSEDLSGAGYGEHQPVASNENPEGRRRNRRIEIVMFPNLNLIATATEGGKPSP